MTDRKRGQGFTLIELVIALALTGIVALLALEGVRLNAMALGRLSDRTDRLEARRGLEDLLRRELGAAFAASLRRDQPVFAGSPEAVRFLTLAEDGGAGIWRVTLAVEARDGVRRLTLTRRRREALGAAGEQRAVLVPRLGALRIAYFGSDTPGATARWQDEWQGRRDLPTLVRFDLDAGDGLVRPPLLVRLWTGAR
jgi:general secretion pathway protein J